MRIALLIASLGFAAVANAQIPQPPFGTTFTAALTRGYWFQAPANGVVTSISVPNEASQPFQAIEFIDFGTTPPPAFSATVVGTQLHYSNNTAGGSTVPVAIPLIAGRHYGVLGACTNAVGSTTSYNSYATGGGTFSSTILGVPTTLTRLVTQSGIGGSGGASSACSSEPGGTLSRVNLTIVNTCASVPTTTAGGNSQNGTMFNIVNTSASALTVGSFDQLFPGAGNVALVEIYTKAGTWSGAQTNPAAWTLVGATSNLAAVASPALTPVPIAVNVTIAPGATQAFYVTCTGANLVSYTTGSNQLGAVIGSDGNMQVTAGIGVAYPFGTNFGLPSAGRLWNGRVNYCLTAQPATNTTLGAGCGGTFNSFYQLFADAAAAAPGLTGNTLQLTPTANGYQGAWLPGTAAANFVPPTGGVALTTGDDGVVNYTIAAAPFPTPQGPQTTLQISGNAIIAWGAAGMNYPGTNSYTPTASAFLNSTLGGIYAWHDYNVSEGGQILAQEVLGTLFVTFNNVENYPTNVANPSTMQFQLNLATGGVRIVWLSVDASTASTFGTRHLVGVSAPGTSADPGQVALATAFGGQLLTADPEVPALAVTANTLPLVGTLWQLTTSNVPATGAVGVDVFGIGDPGLNDLGFLGAPGCGLRASTDVTNAWFVSGSTHAYSILLPANPALLNFNLYTTSAVFQAPAVNALGAVTGNGVRATIGNL